MLIDWFTVAAQIANFLILIFLLKHFLYDRILLAMDKREERIQNRLEEARDKKQEAEEEAESYRKRRARLESERSDMLAKAKEEAEKERKRMVREARDKVEAMRREWRESLAREKTVFIRELRRMATQEVYAVCRKALRDLADAGVDETMVQVFLERLAGLEEEDRNAMIEAARSNGNRVTVRSSFEIPAKLKQKLSRKIHEQLSDDVNVDYETDKDVTPGIELRMKGRKLSWGFEEYLDDLEERAQKALEAETEQEERETS
ncbi:MAG: F0F1 ATP synthase subunit B [Thermodesulfobacteriota bacterium]